MWKTLAELRLRFRLDKKPYECEACLKGPVMLARYTLVAQLLAKRPDPALTQELRKLVAAKKKFETHLRQLEVQRAYNGKGLSDYLRINPRCVQVTEDFGASYDINGRKWVGLIWTLKSLGKHGELESRFIYNVCSSKNDRSEDAYFVADCWDHALGTTADFNAFDEIIVRCNTRTTPDAPNSK
jgi:hypothetical protein